MADRIVKRVGNTATVHLDERRLYAERPRGRGAYYVGPGEVDVPRHVAEAWGLEWGAEPPWTHYDDLTAEQVLARAEGISDDERAAVIAYETGGKGRKTVLEGLGATVAEKPATKPAATPAKSAPAGGSGTDAGGPDAGTGGAPAAGA